MSAAVDERAEGLAMLDELVRTHARLAASRKELALQCIDRRALPEDERALAAADAKLAQLQAQIDEGRRLLGVDAPPGAKP